MTALPTDPTPLLTAEEETANNKQWKDNDVTKVNLYTSASVFCSHSNYGFR